MRPVSRRFADPSVMAELRKGTPPTTPPFRLLALVVALGGATTVLLEALAYCLAGGC